VENFSPQIIKRVAKELQDLASSPPEGIKVFTSDDDITNIQATIEGPGLDHKTKLYHIYLYIKYPNTIK
jgi:ubiquitin-conjugating enzyme E2 S